MYVSGMKYNPMTATLGALILGVGSEYAILTMERFYEEKAKTENVMEALFTATGSIGAAIVASGLTTVFGFAALTSLPPSPTDQQLRDDNGALCHLRPLRHLHGLPGASDQARLLEEKQG